MFRAKSGRPKLISVRVAEKVLRDLLAGRFRPESTSNHLKVSKWSGAMVAVHLKNEYGIECTPQTGVRVLRDAREGGKVYFAYCWSRLVGKKRS